MSKPKNSKDALEFIHTLDSLAIKKQKDEIERLKAEVERLREAGDAMVLKLPDMMAGVVKAEEAIGLMNDWIAAKEGKPSV